MPQKTAKKNKNFLTKSGKGKTSLKTCAEKANKTIKIKAVIFDMDGVITDTMPYHYKVWHEIFVGEGLPVTREDIYKREGQKGVESVREVFAAYGKSIQDDHALSLLTKKEKRFKEIFKQRFIKGSRSFLKKTHGQGFKLALVTGTSRHEAQKLLPTKLFDLFSVTVCGCDVQNGKPHPEPYLMALKQLGIDPAHALVIENAPFGVRSAKAAGLRCFALETSLPRSHLTHADEVFHSFKDLSMRTSFQLI